MFNNKLEIRIHYLESELVFLNRKVEDERDKRWRLEERFEQLLSHLKLVEEKQPSVVLKSKD